MPGAHAPGIIHTNLSENFKSGSLSTEPLQQASSPIAAIAVEESAILVAVIVFNPVSLLLPLLRRELTIVLRVGAGRSAGVRLRPEHGNDLSLDA